MTIEHQEPQRSAARTDGETVIDSEGDWRDAETKQIVQRIEVLRQSIDNIDMAIVALLAERFKATTQVGVLKAEAGFAPADYTREEYQIERLQQIAQGAGLDPQIALMYKEFVVTEAKKRHKRIADSGDDPGVLDIFA
ncbi:chorismate mutase [Bifidobacterium pseudolongum]|uniref:chorismate mutase n=1 Tax=Bifidobacterium pseudolongum TaxID=1694 RepID=UPI001021B35E|nr:chorismate mutase [Bifidobacterium pseudolongum]